MPDPETAAGGLNSPLAAAQIPLGLYLHFPWCVRKCPYCDFNSHSLRGELDEPSYVAALLRDLDWELSQRPEPREIRTIFMGGGTPSLFSGAAITELMDGLRARLKLAADAEITMEANPGTVDEAHFAGYRAAGVNRLSIGVQSFSADKLKALGRIHDPQDARRAVRVARGAGFENFNLDLMFALPGQSLAQAAEDLEAALALAPTHLSYYHLTIEPNTAFAQAPPALPDEDAGADMLDQALATLGAAGFDRYEVSAYAQPGREARHNLNYWQFGDYLALGAGAHGKRSAMDGLWRSARQRHPQKYLQTAGTAAVLQEHTAILDEQRQFEYLMNSLRLSAAQPLADYESRTGLAAAALQDDLAPLQARGLVRIKDGAVGATELGLAHLNIVLGQVLAG